MTASILNCTDEQYYADPCAVPSLSQSVAHTLVTRSPLHAYTFHPRLGKQREGSTRATDNGHLLHNLLLGKGSNLTVVDAKDFRTKAAQEARDAAIAAGRTPIIKSVYESVRALSGALLAHLDAIVPGFSVAESEVAIQWDEDGRHGPVRCRGRMDKLIITEGRALIVDVKSIADASPKGCAKSAYNFGYDIQRAAYVSAVEKLHSQLAGRVDFLFMFIESDIPFSIVPARLDGAMREMGTARWQRAVILWEECLRTGQWPGYADAPIELEAPPWALGKELEVA